MNIALQNSKHAHEEPGGATQFRWQSTLQLSKLITIMTEEVLNTKVNRVPDPMELGTLRDWAPYGTGSSSPACSTSHLLGKVMCEMMVLKLPGKLLFESGE